MRKFEDLSEKELTVLAKRLGALLSAGDVVILTGDLGAGKTFFTKGIAQALGVTQTVKSPTFTIVREYRGGRLPLFHMDVYRVGDDPDSFDMDGYLAAGGVTIIEWGEMLGPDLPVERLTVTFDKVSDDRRTLILSADGEYYEELLRKL